METASSEIENSSSERRRSPERRENQIAIPGLQNPSKLPTELVRPNLDVSVDQNIERAMRVLKRKLIREGLFKELKLRRYYEKPCEKRKRKKKEALKRVRKEEHRQKRSMNGLF